MRALVLIIALLAASPSVAMRKIFPATRDSVLCENLRADAASIPRYDDEAQMRLAVDSGELIPVPILTSPRLPASRRYVRPEVAEFMLQLDTRFFLVTGHFLTVDSAVRPATVQKRLCRHNRSAAPATGARASSHERGTTFDISRRMSRRDYRWLLSQLEYYRAVGRILVIEERACVHIFVGGNHETIRTDSNSAGSVVADSMY